MGAAAPSVGQNPVFIRTSFLDEHQEIQEAFLFALQIFLIFVQNPCVDVHIFVKFLVDF